MGIDQILEFGHKILNLTLRAHTAHAVILIGDNAQKLSVRSAILRNRNGGMACPLRQAEDIRRVYGGFDWQREMRDPAFGRLIAAGVDGRTAYEVVHSRELLAQAMRYGAKRAAEQCSRAIASGGRRVAENGGHSSSAVTRTDPKALDSAQLADIRRRVQRGEKIRF